jgi:hypothetical protein
MMQTLENFTFARFEGIMREQVNILSNDHSALTPPDDLSAPEFFLDTLEELTSLMKTHDASLGAEDAESESTADNKFTPVLRVAFDPFLELAKSSAAELPDATARAIYTTNVLLTARSTISAFPFASVTHLNPISTALSSLRMELLEIQHRYLLDASGLGILLAALEPFSPSSTTSKPESEGKDGHAPPQADKQPTDIAEIADLPAFQPEALIAVSQQLDDFLPSALMDATDNLKHLQSASFVQSVTEEAVEAFCRDFEFVEGMIIGADEARDRVDIKRTEDGSDAGVEDDVVSSSGKVSDGDEQESGLRRLFPRTTGEIRVLLS